MAIENEEREEKGAALVSLNPNEAPSLESRAWDEEPAEPIGPPKPDSPPDPNDPPFTKDEPPASDEPPNREDMPRDADDDALELPSAAARTSLEVVGREGKEEGGGKAERGWWVDD